MGNGAGEENAEDAEQRGVAEVRRRRHARVVKPVPFNAMTGTLWKNANTRPAEVIDGATTAKWFATVCDPQVDACRSELTEEWLRLPEWARPEFESRLLSHNESDLVSAVSELRYMQWLRESGFDCSLVKQVAQASTPDFEIGLNGCPIAIGECQVHSLNDNSGVLLDFLLRVERYIGDRCIRYAVSRFKHGAKQPSPRTVAREIEKIAQNDQCGMFIKVEVPGSDWNLFVRVVMRDAPAPPGMRLGGTIGECVGWRGGDLMARVLKEKRKQHRERSAQVVICLAWNDLLHRLNSKEIRDLLWQRSSSMRERGVCGIFFVEELLPWALPTARPCFYHWGDPLSARIAGSWHGESVSVNC